MNQNERAFRHLVKRSRASLRAPLTDLRAAYEHFPIPCGDTFTTAELSRVVMERIAAVLRARGDAKGPRLVELERGAPTESVIIAEPPCN